MSSRGRARTPQSRRPPRSSRNGREALSALQQGREARPGQRLAWGAAQCSVLHTEGLHPSPSDVALSTAAEGRPKNRWNPKRSAIVSRNPSRCRATSNESRPGRRRADRLQSASEGAPSATVACDLGLATQWRLAIPCQFHVKHSWHNDPSERIRRLPSDEQDAQLTELERNLPSATSATGRGAPRDRRPSSLSLETHQIEELRPGLPRRRQRWPAGPHAEAQAQTHPRRATEKSPLGQ